MLAATAVFPMDRVRRGAETSIEVRCAAIMAHSKQTKETGKVADFFTAWKRSSVVQGLPGGDLGSSSSSLDTSSSSVTGSDSSSSGSVENVCEVSMVTKL